MKYLRPQTTSPLDPNDRKDIVKSIKWGWFARRGYKPHTAQMDLHLSDARTRIGIAGTRGGKSRFAGEEIAPYFLAGNTRIWLIGQTYDTTEKEFRYAYDALHSEAFYETIGNPSDMLIKDVYNKKGGDMHIMSAWGSEIECKSLERPKLAFGEECDLIVFCEPAQISNPKETYERIIYGRLTSRQGDLIISGTPAGKAPKHDPDGWLFEQYLKGMIGSDVYDPNCFTRCWVSWENPEFKEDPYEIRRWMNPLIFAEQYEGQFVTFSGTVYESFDPLVHVLRPFNVPNFWNRYEAIDPGFSGQFYWCAGIVGYDGALYIIDEYSDTEHKYVERANEIWKRRLAVYNLPYKPFREISDNVNLQTWKKAQAIGSAPSICALYIDPEDPQFILEFAQYGLGGIKANNDLHIGINRVSQRFNKEYPMGYITSDCPILIDSMCNLAWGEKTTGDIRKPENNKYKHSTDALRYMCMGGLSGSIEPKSVLQDDGVALDEIMGLTARRSNEYGYERDPYMRRMNY